jgi:nicotinamide riboside transporter PnuC
MLRNVIFLLVIAAIPALLWLLWQQGKKRRSGYDTDGVITFVPAKTPWAMLVLAGVMLAVACLLVVEYVQDL